MEKIESDYGAITIDNDTYKGLGYRFDGGLLAQLMQFKESPVIVLQTDIVHNEAIKHIGQEISNARASISKALRSANKKLMVSDLDIGKAKALLTVTGNDDSIAEAKLNQYYDAIGATVISSSDYVDLSALLRKYFDTEAPFESGKDKKNEFPDAIALLSLEGWAKENDINVIAVSQDRGWRNFSESSQRITLVSDLSEALEKFQPHSKVASIIAKLREGSFLGSTSRARSEIAHALADSIDPAYVLVKASSDFRFQWEVTAAMYVSHQLDLDKDGFINVRLIRIGTKSLVFKVGATVCASIEANFDFNLFDMADSNYVDTSDQIHKTMTKYHTDILLTLEGDFAKGFDGLLVKKVDVLDVIGEVNFGPVSC
jgi:hypothetical protein